MKFKLSNITLFLKEVRLEMKKVNWPTRQELFRYTIMVVGVSVFVALYLGGIDFILGLLRERFLLK